MTKEEFDQQKAKALSESLKNTAEALIKSTREGGEQMEIRNILIYQMGRSELLKIVSVPYSEFPKELAIVGESGPEIKLK